MQTSSVKRSKRVLAVALAAVAGIGLAACSGGSGGGGAAGDLTATGPITIWYSNNATELEWGKQMVEAWNAENPDQKITGQEIPAGKSSEEVIGAAITAGNAPCLVFNTAPSAVGQFEKQGGLVNLSDFDDGASYIEERSGDIAKQYQNADGDYFQLPWKSNPVVIFYNKDLFAAAGLDPENPKLSTYDDFIATSKTLVDAGVAPFAIQPAPTSEFFQMQFDFMPLYAAATGGTPLIEDGKATFADDKGTEVAQFWRDLYDQKLAGQEQYQGDAFADGQAAMAIVGPWAISVYDGVNFGSVPVPTPEATDPKDVWTFSDAKNVGLFSACENKGTAWNVLKFATSEDQDGKFLETTGQMPLRQDLPTVYADYFAANPAYQAFGDQASRTVEVPGGPNTVQIMQAFRDAWSKSVIFGEGDVGQSLTDVATKIDQLATQP
ncbi:extracellular solute-binding protein [Herbiconiux ginsengi]|uniref:Carbohydrate ABC transporter substrate-binding protein, CUT1 family n=1 Tax=Herbiconiux ginsengi TaxID=381665 RepID=A0A1H3MIU8_9MICO|nr:extracellular solute-binding protein [Herbiconiux ginsengi]SDY76318.1 carbohydrate ABC transporter substrate-binding protein, CUT1 family [Herbiconiux ginsengi]